MRTFILTFFCFFLLIFTSVFAQKKGLNVTTETKIMGKSYIYNSEIKGVEYLFPNKINDIFFDSENNFATVQLEKKQKKGTNTVEQANTGIYYLSYKDYKFITNNGKTFIINDEGIKVAELDVSSNAFIVGDYLYDKKDRSFFAVDLKNIF